MANYQPSILLEAVGIITDRFNAHEMRPGFFGATETFLKYRDYSIPNLADIRKSPQRTTTVRYLDKTTQSTISARSCSPTAAFGDSSAATITWSTIGFTVYESKKLFQNNYYSAQQAFANDLYGGMLNAHEALETAIVAYLEANKTGVNNGSAWMGTFDTVNDIYDVAVADKTRYYNYMQTVMRENLYRGELDCIQNIAAGAVMMEQLAQGPGNSANQAYQYGNILFHESNYVTTASDYLINSYVFNPYSVALLDWIPPLNVQGLTSGENEWTTMGDLFGLPITWSVFKKSACDSSVSLGGEVQDLLTVWEITCDFGLVKAPITTATETPIYKFGLKTT
jgi:hypothetical protein